MHTLSRRHAPPPGHTYGFLPLILVMGVIWFLLILGATLPSLQAILTPPLELTVRGGAMLGSGWLEGVAVSPDGGEIALASSVGVWLYEADLQGGARLLQGHSAPVQAVAYHPQGHILASAGWDDTVRLWDVATGELIHSLRAHRSDVMALAFSPDGAWVLSGAYDRTAYLWDVATGEQVLALTGHEDNIEAVAFAPGGDALVTAGRDGTLRRWATDGTLLERLKVSDERILALAFAPDGRLYAGGRDGVLRAWHEGEQVATLALGGVIHELVWGRDGLWLGWSDEAGHQVGYWDGMGADVRDVALLQSAPVGIGVQNAHIIIASDAGDVARYDGQGERVAQIGAGHSGAVNALAFSPDGAYLASGGGNIFTDDKALRLWDVATERLVRVMDEHEGWLRSLAYSPDGAWVAVGTMTGQVMVYEASSGEVVHRFGVHEGIVLSLAFAPDGRKLASGGADEQIHIYDMSDGTLLASVERAGGPVHTLLIDFDTDFSDSASVTAQLSAFNLPDVGGVSLLCGHGDDVEGTSFNPTRTLRATSTYQNDIQLTDFTHGTFIRALEGHRNWVNDTTFSPDGRLLASASYDLTARLWDVVTGDALAELEGHTRPVTRVVFSPDGGLLASASEDGSVRLWALER